MARMSDSSFYELNQKSYIIHLQFNNFYPERKSPEAWKNTVKNCEASSSMYAVLHGVRIDKYNLSASLSWARFELKFKKLKPKNTPDLDVGHIMLLARIYHHKENLI